MPYPFIHFKMQVIEYLKSILGEKYYLDEVLILGPYPSTEFVTELLCHSLQRRTPTSGPEVTLLIDDGWDTSRVDEIVEDIPSGRGIRQPKPTIRRVAASNARGLVHAKLYYFRVMNLKKNLHKKTYFGWVSEREPKWIWCPRRDLCQHRLCRHRC